MVCHQHQIGNDKGDLNLLSRRCLWQNLQRDRIILVTERVPESDGCRVLNQHIDRQSLVRWPEVGTQNFNSSPPDALSAPVAHDEQLTQIDFLRLLAI